ncbi:MAG: UbiA family prenyltransferase [Chlorobi bacterium]|nr:UbiA family prenyltransferase [Chlorobiota bacterium]
MVSNFLKLVRAKNLLIIIFTQYLMRYAVIFPILKSRGYSSQFSDFNFFLLVLTTVLLAAAGYAINDYFDTKTDLINRPETVVVGNHINRRHVMTLHIILNTLAIITGFYVSLQIHIWKLIYIYIIITGLLWFYSTSYKKQFLTGNIIVAVLTAMVPMMTVLYEIPPLNKEYFDTLIELKDNFNDVFFWVTGFSAFAFLTTLNREIIKDVEDFEGDAAYGSRTLPVVAGIKTSKTVTISLTAITVILLFCAYKKYIMHPYSDNSHTDYISAIYLGIFIILPSLFMIFKILKAENKKDWHTVSTISKIIMLFGVLYAFIVYYNFSY